MAPNTNTDSRKYEGLYGTSGWGPKEFPHANLMAIEAAFFDTTVKQKLRRAYAAPGVHDLKVVDSWECSRIEEIRA